MQLKIKKPLTGIERPPRIKVQLKATAAEEFEEKRQRRGELTLEEAKHVAIGFTRSNKGGIYAIVYNRKTDSFAVMQSGGIGEDHDIHSLWRLEKCLFTFKKFK